MPRSGCSALHGVNPFKKKKKKKRNAILLYLGKTKFHPIESFVNVVVRESFIGLPIELLSQNKALTSLSLNDKTKMVNY